MPDALFTVQHVCLLLFTLLWLAKVFLSCIVLYALKCVCPFTMPASRNRHCRGNFFKRYCIVPKTDETPQCLKHTIVVDNEPILMYAYSLLSSRVSPEYS